MARMNCSLVTMIHPGNSKARCRGSAAGVGNIRRGDPAGAGECDRGDGDAGAYHVNPGP